MFERVDKHPSNVPGRYYVDCYTCLDHRLCVEVAPHNFRQDEEHRAYVYKQPENREEEAQCREALRQCPVAAIGGDG